MFDNIVGLLQLMNEKSLPHLKVNRRDINESSELSSVTFVSRRHNTFVVISFHVIEKISDRWR